MGRWIALSCCCWLLSSGAALWGAQATYDGNTPSSTLTVSPLQGLNDPNGVLRAHPGVTSSQQYFKTIGALLIVLVLGGLVVYASKRYLPKLGPVGGKEIHIVETIGIGSRKSLHLIQVGSQQVLIGTTPDRVVALTEIRRDFDALVQSQIQDSEDDS